MLQMVEMHWHNTHTCCTYKLQIGTRPFSRPLRHWRAHPRAFFILQALQAVSKCPWPCQASIVLNIQHHTLYPIKRMTINFVNMMYMILPSSTQTSTSTTEKPFGIGWVSQYPGVTVSWCPSNLWGTNETYKQKVWLMWLDVTHLATGVHIKVSFT